MCVPKAPRLPGAPHGVREGIRLVLSLLLRRGSLEELLGHLRVFVGLEGYVVEVLARQPGRRSDHLDGPDARPLQVDNLGDVPVFVDEDVVAAEVGEGEGEGPVAGVLREGGEAGAMAVNAASWS